jgi:SAM-dependent methyltransferase
MSAKPQHNGLSADDRSKIRSAILSSREILESEFERQLERYGVYDDERVPLSKLGHLSLQDRETRREIDAAFERELEATEDYQRAYRNYVREATKEYLNRYVGLKTIEARGLVTETLTSKAEYGNRSYLHYTVDEIAGELTDAPDDGLGVALDLAFQEIGAEIRILFEDTDYTAIEPEFTVRRDVFEELDELDDDAWAADEAIGWVYQYFGEKEREEIDERIQDHNYKVQDTDIATKTQLFTPRYIVEYLVDNSLGRMWLEMYGGDTSIDDEDNCFYLTPVEESLTDREQKDPREITVLDPACGGGHFLFYAFDVLYEMYQERTDVVESQIPREILKNNLYGIDIDPGAVQLAALALYLKAKTIEPDVTIEQLNIISADAVLINGERKEQILNEVELDIEERLIEQIWTSFEHVREWGSLVNIKERVEELIEEEREELEKFQKQGQARLTSDGKMVTQSSFITEQEGEISWEELKERLIDDAREIANKALEQNSVVDELFAGEVEKSVELLDVLLKEYDVVVANPPYLQSSKMGDTLKEFVRANYKGKRDLYASFIERSLQFSKEEGYVAMVTPENFMFTYSFRGVRKKLLNLAEIVEAAHLSGHSFSMKDRPFTVSFVLKSGYSGEETASRFYRLTHEQESYDSFEKTVKGLKQVSIDLRQGELHNDVYVVNQQRFNDIGRRPFLYWFGQETLDLFGDHPKLGDLADIKQGLATGDDDRFVRKWWEFPLDELNTRYIRLQKSGTDSVYYDYAEDYVDWANEGKEIKSYSGSRPQNEEYYFQSGVTYRSFGNHLTGRLQAEDMIFSHKSNYVSPDSHSDTVLLAHLNSTLHRYIINGLNPGLNFEVGDGKRLPIKEEVQCADELKNLVDKGIERRQTISELTEISADFNPDVFTEVIRESSVVQLQFIEEKLNSGLMHLHGTVDDLIFEEYEISEETQASMYANLPKNISKYSHISNFEGGRPEISGVTIGTKQIADQDLSSILKELSENPEKDLRELAQELEISPYSVALARGNHDLYSSDQKKEAAGRIVSFLLGTIFDRWETNLDLPKASGEILVFDDESENSVEKLVNDSLDVLYNDPYAMRETLKDVFSKPATTWLRESFFRYHHGKEYRRRGQRIPIYWQLASEDETFSCYIYYHSMTADTLPKLRGQYVDSRIQELQNRISNVEAEVEGTEGDRERNLRNELEDLQNQLDDVQDFGERLDSLIDDGFEPDFEAGIWENIQKVDEYDLLQTELDKL